MLIHDPAKQPFNQGEVIATYRRLIRSMPRANQYLLLYVLDLLSVFARRSMTAAGLSLAVFFIPTFCLLTQAIELAVIFRPGLLSHPAHKSSADHDLSQRVLEFLIAQQDWFMLDIPPPPQTEPESLGSWIPSVLVDYEPFALGDAWNLVSGDNAPTIIRRNTTAGGCTHVKIRNEAVF
jgi:hypothetical protein